MLVAMRPPAFFARFLVVALVGGPAFGGCSNVVDPSKLRDKPISSLDADQIRGLCAHNTAEFRKQVPQEDWTVPYCGGRVLASQALLAKMRTVPKEECLREIVECSAPMGNDHLTPEKDCERVDPANAKSCGAPVAQLQACLAERTETFRAVSKKIRTPAICDEPEPLRAIDLLATPACQALKKECPGFTLALPGFIRAIR